MGFSAVYKTLQDVFPQVDSRLLKACAIEHSKDVDVAVQVVLSEIIPTLPAKQPKVSSPKNSSSTFKISEVAVDDGKTGQPQTYPALNQSTKSDRLAGRVFIPRTFPESSYDNNRLKLREPEVSVPIVTYPPSLDADNESDNELIVLKKRFVNRSDNPDSATSVLVSDMNANDNHDQGFVKIGGENVVSLGASEKDAFAESFEQEDGSTISSVLTESNQDCSTDLLEQIIEEAKNNKQTLVLTMNSVVDLMKEVEVKERAAEEVKEKAAEGCSDILSKVDELKQALIRAKEANDMHAGEVCAEKAILSTELKELQLRLFTMSDERNKSLAILDEMRRALEIRLASAMEIINKAEEEKLEKEKSAREALLYQENQMEKVVEESKNLMLQAEENSKFHEFLMDRGRAIDILQGEISVKCQDVLLLKEKFEKRIPLSRSLSSSQTSSILASSGSFRSTTIAPLEHESETYGSPKKSAELNDSYGVLDRSVRSEAAELPKSPIETVPSYNYANGGENLVDGRQARIVDDGWELFENADYKW